VLKDYLIGFITTSKQMIKEEYSLDFQDIIDHWHDQKMKTTP
jgi:hypothetical protein